MLIRRLFAPAIEALAPIGCPICDAVTDGPCWQCRQGWKAAPVLQVPTGIERCEALFAYEGSVRSVVLATKRTGRSALARWMGSALADAAGGFVESVDLVVWAPTSKSRVSERGFDHGQVLAEAFADRVGLRSAALLERTSGSATQKSAAMRGETSYRLTRLGTRSDLVGRQVLVVDDVRTTGSTLSAAGRALLSAGALKVLALTFAATAPPSPRRPEPRL